VYPTIARKNDLGWVGSGPQIEILKLNGKEAGAGKRATTETSRPDAFLQKLSSTSFTGAFGRVRLSHPLEVNDPALYADEAKELIRQGELVS